MIDRIQLILKSKNLSSSQFADEIQVQRSSVSHILTGRNKPSLDFVSKILSSYPEINSDWLLFGKGQMIKKQEPFLKNPEREEKQENMETGKNVIESTQKRKNSTKSEIEKIIVFYSDNSFEEYSPNN